MSNVQGYLQKRNNKWYYRIKYQDEFGQRKEIMRKGGDTKTETARIMTDKIKEIELIGNTDNITFKALFGKFIDYKKKSGLKDNTINHYIMIFNVYLSDISNIGIKDIKQYHIINILDIDNINGTTKHYIFSFIKSIFKYGYMCGYVSSTAVIDRIVPPKKDKHNKKYMSVDDYKKIIGYLTEHKQDNYKMYLLYCFIVLDAELGLRRGELAGLSWDNVNINDRYIDIKYNLVCDHGKFYICSPKNNSSIRRLYLSDLAVNVLKDMYVNICKNKLFLGCNFIVKPLGFDLVFRWQDGNYVKPSNYYFWFTRLQKKLGIDDLFTIHDLRHFNASILINNQVDIKTVQERLGHSNATTTLNIYAHALDKKQKFVVDVLQNVLD